MAEHIFKMADNGLHRVAITGIGIVSCLGNDLATVGAALREGRSGIVIDPQRFELGFLV